MQLQDRVNKIKEKYEKKALLGLASITPEEFSRLSDDFREMIQHPSRFKIQEKRQLTTMTLILDSQKIITWSEPQHLRCYIIATASS